MKLIACYSGGLDSTVMLAKLQDEGHEVKALGVYYGQKHMRELNAASHFCELWGIRYSRVDLSGLRPMLRSSQTDSLIEVPDGHYAAESMKATVVPNRNMLLLSAAAAWAISERFDGVAYAAHAGDHTIYPDCRPEFINTMGKLLELCDWKQLGLVTPFIDKTKAEIVKIGADLKVPMWNTWSCYKGRTLHCGKCGTCVERREAFTLAGVADITEYEVADVPSNETN